jgi:hypothetical protein
MSVTIIQTPIKVSLSGNRVPVKLATDLTGSEKKFLSIHVKVQEWNGSSWVDVGHDTKLVDENGEAQFFVEEYLKLQTIPAFQYTETDILVKRPGMIFRYRLAWYESYFDATTNTKTTTSESSNQVDYYALDGGIDNELQAQYNKDGTDWLAQLRSNDQFLTWQPPVKQLHTGSIEKLYWLVQSASRIKLKAKRTNTDDTTSESVLAELDVSAYDVIECCVSPGNLYSSLSDLKKYEVWLLNENDTVISETRTYNIDRTYYERNDTFIFTNSLGAIDAIWARGNITEQVDHQRNRFNRILHYDFRDDRKAASSRSVKKKNGEGELGYITEADPVRWKEYYAIEFLGAKDHFKLQGERILPVVVTAEESLILQDTQYIYSQPFKWTESRSSKYYSYQKAIGETYDYITENGEIITENGEGIWE